MKQTHFLILFILTQISCAQTRLPDIESAYAKFEKDSQLKYGLSSLTVMNVKTGEVVFSKNGSIGLAPASTLKTITSISSYYLLGSDFKWETTLGCNGSIVNGTLNGDLIITGGGDPTLGSDRFGQSKPEQVFDRWLSAIRKAGIKKVNGRIIGDDKLFGTQITPLGWIWQDIGNYYGAGATSLCWKENEMGVRFQAGAKAGDIAELASASTTALGIKLVNEVKTGSPGSGDNVYAYSAPYTDIVYLRGTYGIDLKKTVMISMPDPALSLSYELLESLRENGILVSGQATTARRLDLAKEKYSQAASILDRYASPSLNQVVYWLNQKSINLYAENLLKTIAWKHDKPAATEDGVSEVQKFWSRKLNIDANAMAILDGSGLSPENRITSNVMASILRSAVREPWYNAFYESLPLNNEMKMKSGSIRNVLAYTGYHTGSSGVPLVFTFITNNYNGSTSAIKQKMFKVLDEFK